MAGYEPLSFKASTTIPANRIVAAAGDDNVSLAAASTSALIGVSADTVLETSTGIPIKCYGIAKVQFNDTVAAGGLVTSNSAGQGVPYTAVTAATQYIGRLVGPAVSATGTVADVLLQPGSASGE